MKVIYKLTYRGDTVRDSVTYNDLHDTTWFDKLSCTDTRVSSMRLTLLLSFIHVFTH